jgi:hypothetical protein
MKCRVTPWVRSGPERARQFTSSVECLRSGERVFCDLERFRPAGSRPEGVERMRLELSFVEARQLRDALNHVLGEK